AMVAEFAAAGWTVAGCGRNTEAISALRAEFPAPHYFQGADVAAEEDVMNFCEEILRRHGPPDLLLNNAALINNSNPIWEVSAKEFSNVIDVNIKGPASMMRHLIQPMMKRGAGVIVNFSSGWGRSTSPEVAPYCATKYAIEGLSQAVAQETNGTVAVVALNPGIIDTEMLRSSFGADASHYPKADAWAKRAVPYLMKLGLKDNGKSLTAP
ncbi:MAG TPA: SDR family oxidoreductase, partial [Candidatus Saccharimonadia bacterium]|nr:SDR family oxidoreductase [Candidatus Saccharimonadia bacterium]